MRDLAFGGPDGVDSIARPGFLDEQWLTPLQIARKFGYSTDKPIRKAIMSGELKATRSPCRRKLIVAESEVRRWISLDLAFEPASKIPSRASSRPAAPVRRHSTMPRLEYNAPRLRV